MEEFSLLRSIARQIFEAVKLIVFVAMLLQKRRKHALIGTRNPDA